MEVSSIVLSEAANSIHVTVTDQAGLNPDGTLADNHLDLTKVTWSVDSAVSVAADATGFVFSFGSYVAGAPDLTFNAVASYAGANASPNPLPGPNLAVHVTMPAVVPPQVTALRYFSP